MVRLNFDETGVTLVPKCQPGQLVADAVRRARQRQGLTWGVSKNQLRTNFTHMALLSDDKEVQRVLPHILIVNEKIVSQEPADSLLQRLPPSVYLVRDKKAWVCEDTMLHMVRLLDMSLSSFRSTWKFTLSADTYRPHMMVKVLRALGAIRIRSVLIPAKMTWALQPLDTHVFVQYKHQLWVACQSRACRNDTDQPSWGQVVDSIVEVIERVLERQVLGSGI